MNTTLEIQQCIANIPDSEYTGDPLSLNICSGEITCVIGPDHQGKIEWLRTLAGLAEPIAGEIFYDNINTRCTQREHWQQLRRKIAYISSDTSLLSAANGLANVMLAAKYHKIADAETLREQAIALMTELDVQHQHKALPAFMRRDQRHRLALARALMLRPDVLILESPFAHSDGRSSQQLKEFLLARVKNDRISLVIMTHDIEFSLKHAQHILFVDREQVYCFDSAKQLLTSQITSIHQYLAQPGSH